MSVLGRPFISRFCVTCIKKSMPSVATARFSGKLAHNNKDVEDSLTAIPEPIPGMIQSAVLKKYSAPLVIENIPAPKNLKPNEVLIDVNYCACNGPDVLLSENSYKSELNPPLVLGFELAGKLIQVGPEAEKTGYKVGDKVVALNKERFSGFAEQCVVEVGDIWKLPSSVKSIDAVTLLANYMTALIGFENCGALEEHDTTLINVGLRGAGLAAVDVATNVYRAKAIAICASEETATMVREEKGAFAAFKYSEKKLIKQIEEIAGELDIKGIFEGDDGERFKKMLNCFTNIYQTKTLSKDMLRDDNFATVVQYLSREGKVVIAGIAETKDESQADNKESGFSVTGINLREYRKNNRELYRQAGEDALSYFEEGLIKPSCSLIAGLYKINDAMKAVIDKKSCGKVVIDLKDKDAKLVTKT
ncbi:quinone oxidoreductase-like protein 2 [Belonocnema kinseyi]|uniref:quinone oxidoreductase-like protein 2 n=1 Tax=Belonocnema kinseyi TaxID=2817044 RepID=UPI00143D52DD|nr:quinone oxidoreductase-like protein 2 [Belonocnema kinseyi]